jgi:hypothetical protein
LGRRKERKKKFTRFYFNNNKNPHVTKKEKKNKNMQPLLLFVIAASLLLRSSLGLQSYNLLDVYIEWSNQGDQTQFKISSPLAGTIDVTNAWIGVGVNSAAQMVTLLEVSLDFKRKEKCLIQNKLIRLVQMWWFAAMPKHRAQ